jgi:diketogulonate reductase-like aldo/keto reductase
MKTNNHLTTEFSNRQQVLQKGFPRQWNPCVLERIFGLVRGNKLPFLLGQKTSRLAFATTCSPTTFTTATPSSIARSTRLASRMSSTSADREALMKCPTIPLRNGMTHPAIGFGTYKVVYLPASASSAVTIATTAAALTNETKERSAHQCVLDALQAGYRFLECAEFYGNEAQVGQAIKESGIARDDLFLCSKVWTTTIEKGPNAIKAQLEKTLTDLGTSYLDLYLIHWPVPHHHVEAYKTLQQLQLEGEIKGIGVSNYAVEDIQELLNTPGITEIPLVNQIEINPFLYRKNTIQYCRDQGIVLQSYRSLRDGKAMDHPTLVAMAARYNKTVAQLLGRWCVQHGFVYIPKSIKTHRMIENGRVFDFELQLDDMQALDSLTTNDNLQAFLQLYHKCVNRDTTKDGTMDGVKMEITID